MGEKALRFPGRGGLSAGGEDSSAPTTSTNDRNGAQGATSEVGGARKFTNVRFSQYAKELKQLSCSVRSSFVVRGPSY